jgi:uncharacterized membrane protein
MAATDFVLNENKQSNRQDTMSAQISVVIAYYRDVQRCATALHSLEMVSGTARAIDAAVLSRGGPTGHLRISERADFHGASDSARSIGSVFPPHILELPPVGQTSRKASGFFEDQGLDVNLLKEVGENLPPNGAALVIMVEESWLNDLTGILSGYADLERYVMRPDETSEIEGEL